MRPQPLPPDELAAFWSIGCPLEALFVPDDELVRAGVEGRIQYASSFSMMGTAETGWRRRNPGPTSSRDDYAVVPPGQLAEDWPSEADKDDRDVDRVLWQPFRAKQHAAIARALTGDAADVVILEAARRVAEAARQRPSPPTQLIDWLLTGDGFRREDLDVALAQPNPPLDVIWAIRACWLEPSVAAALDAFTRSRSETRYPVDPVPRMELLRFAVRASRGLEPVAHDPRALAECRSRLSLPKVTLDARGQAELISALTLDGPREPFVQLSARLQSRQEPWGALIALQLDGRTDAALERSVALSIPLRQALWHRGFVRAASIGPFAWSGGWRERQAAAGATLDRFLRWGPAAKLESLELCATPGSEEDRLDAYMGASAPFPATLRRLRAAGLTAPDVFVALLGGVRNLLPQLEALDLSGGSLDSYRMQYFVPLLPKLRHLKELDLRGNYLSADDAKRIQADVAGAKVDAQRALPTLSPKVEDGPSTGHGPDHRAFLRIHGIKSIEDIED